MSVESIGAASQTIVGVSWWCIAALVLRNQRVAGRFFPRHTTHLRLAFALLSATNGAHWLADALGVNSWLMHLSLDVLAAAAAIGCVFRLWQYTRWLSSAIESIDGRGSGDR